MKCGLSANRILSNSNGTSQIFPAACVSYVLRPLGVYFVGDRMIVLLIVVLLVHCLCFAVFISEKKYSAAAWVVLSGIWASAALTK